VLGLDEALVRAVLEDWRSAPVEPRMRAALGFLEKLTLEPDTLTRADVAALHEAGLNDRAIYEAAYVAFLFGVMDRLADAFDFRIPDAEQVKVTGQFLNKRGYKMLKLIR
jgi:uncharacterized peroxidase-related enzyme